MWLIISDGDKDALSIYARHYSFYKYRDGRQHKKFIGPGEYLCLITPKSDALFVWRKFKDKSGNKGVNCSVFRNESGVRSSELIKEAMGMAFRKWPGQRLYTYVNPRKIRSTNPGYCFIQAGWRKCGVTKKRGLVILEYESV